MQERDIMEFAHDEKCEDAMNENKLIVGRFGEWVFWEKYSSGGNWKNLTVKKSMPFRRKFGA